MKRDRGEDEKIVGASKTKAAFFQSTADMAVQSGVQNNQRNINDFPDFIQYFLKMNTCSGISEFIPEVMQDNRFCIINTNKLVHPVQYGWDQRGRTFVCLMLRGDFNENRVLILHRSSQNGWQYCTCGHNSMVSPFEFDENNSRFGDFLTNPQVSCQAKVRALEQLFQNYRERLPAPDF